MAAERILVVDDEDNARRAIATILEARRATRSPEAADGEDALARMPDFSPAVVLSDVRMPQMDGLTLLQEAREQGRDATFVMMTAYGTVKTAVKAMSAGAEDYLSKPLDVEEVVVVLQKALEKRSLRREARIAARAA